MITRNGMKKNFKNNPLFKENIDFHKIDYPRLNAAVFYATNEQRVKFNLKALEFNIFLEKQASLHSKNMVMNNFFSHDDPVNKKFATPHDRAAFVRNFKSLYCREYCITIWNSVQGKHSGLYN